MTRAIALIVAAIELAPYQCARQPDPAERREETPGEALYGLAQEFHEKGDESSYRTTLAYIVRRYPSSRFALMAKDDLADAGLDAAASP